jgi:hypothetical protein
LKGENVMVGLKEHLFRWDEFEWEEVTEEDKKRIIKFIIHNYDPKLSQTAKIEKTDAKTIKITDEKSSVFLMLEANKGKINIKIAEKTNELIVKKNMDKKDSKEFIVYPTNSAQEPGDRFVGPTCIVLTLTYLLLLSVIIHILVQFWPYQAFTDEKANSSHPPVSPVTFFRWTFPLLPDEERLFFIVALAGALGSLVHALRSFYWYAGNRELVLSWLAIYLLLSVIGALLGLIFVLQFAAGSVNRQRRFNKQAFLSL